MCDGEVGEARARVIEGEAEAREGESNTIIHRVRSDDVNQSWPKTKVDRSGSQRHVLMGHGLLACKGSLSRDLTITTHVQDIIDSLQWSTTTSAFFWYS